MFHTFVSPVIRATLHVEKAIRKPTIAGADGNEYGRGRCDPRREPRGADGGHRMGAGGLVGAGKEREHLRERRRRAPIASGSTTPPTWLAVGAKTIKTAMKKPAPATRKSSPAKS